MTHTDNLEPLQDGAIPVTEGKSRLLHDRRVQLAAVVAVAWVAFLQGTWVSEGQEAPAVYEAGALVAAGELESVLYDPSLGRREEGPKASDEFRNQQGQTCRRFSDGQVTGVACRAGGDWRLIEMRQD